MQIAIFVLPVMVLVGWAIGKPFLLDLEPFAALVLTLSVIHTYFVSSDGNSNWCDILSSSCHVHSLHASYDVIMQLHTLAGYCTAPFVEGYLASCSVTSQPLCMTYHKLGAEQIFWHQKPTFSHVLCNLLSSLYSDQQLLLQVDGGRAYRNLPAHRTPVPLHARPQGLQFCCPILGKSSGSMKKGMRGA